MFWVDPKAKPNSLALKFALFDWDRIGADPLGYCSLTLGEVRRYTSLTTLELPIDVDGIKQRGKEKREEGGTLHFDVMYVKKKDLETNHLVAENHMENLMSLFFERPFSIPVVARVAYSETTDEMSNSICNLAFEANQVRTLCRELVRINVHETHQENTLFRTNSTATKTVRTLFTKNGKSYIRAALGGIIDKILDDPSGYEINEAKLPEAERSAEKALHPGESEEKISERVLQKNKQKVHNACGELVRAVSKSLEDCPQIICQILSDVRAIVADKFPDSYLIAVGGFYFLRFVVPCIATPEHYGMTDLPSISGMQRRALTVVSKVVQNMANKKSFDHKEGFMTMMNPTIDELTPSVQQFLDDISKREAPLAGVVVVKEIPKIQKKVLISFIIFYYLFIYSLFVCHPFLTPFFSLSKIPSFEELLVHRFFTELFIFFISFFLRFFSLFPHSFQKGPKAKNYSLQAVECMAYLIGRLTNSFKAIHQKIKAENEAHADYLTLIQNRLQIAFEVTEEGTNSLLRSFESGTCPTSPARKNNRVTATASSAAFMEEVVPSALAQASSKKKVLWRTGGEKGDAIDLAGNKTFSFTKDDLAPGPYVLRFGVLPVLVSQMNVTFEITFQSAKKKEIVFISAKLSPNDDEEMRTINVGLGDGPATMQFSCAASMGLGTMKVKASLAQGEKRAFFGRNRMNGGSHIG